VIQFEITFIGIQIIGT